MENKLGDAWWAVAVFQYEENYTIKKTSHH